MIALLLPLLTPAAAQGSFERLPVVYVCDSSADAVWRLVDLDGDGSMNGPGEASLFYDEAQGSIELGNPCALALANDGALLLNDSTVEQVIRLIDLDGDGDCHDPGEHMVFFDGSTGGSASGLFLASSFALDVDASGRLWATNADYGSGTSPDCIFWCEDLNGDGDAMDAGESAVWYSTPSGGGIGDSTPSAVRVGQDGRVYYVENGHSGFQPKGIYALDDANGDGLIDPLTEVSAFYLPPQHGSPTAYYALSQRADGVWLLPDLAAHVIWALKDGNGDGVITHEWEAEIVWAPGQSQVWGIDQDANGGTWLAESTNPDRVERLEDVNANGLYEPFEASTPYSDAVSAVEIAAPRALEVGESLVPGSTVCDGGTSIACPCGNDGSPGRGCENSTGVGALVEGFGRAIVADDSFLLRALALPAGRTGVLVQGAGVLGVPFRDGVLCAAAPTVRLETFAADVDGCYASTGALAAAGGVSPGDTRVYQLWYRDPVGPCGSGSNFSNAWAVAWQ